jgi:hypothetical protein
MIKGVSLGIGEGNCETFAHIVPQSSSRDAMLTLVQFGFQPGQVSVIDLVGDDLQALYRELDIALEAE